MKASLPVPVLIILLAACSQPAETTATPETGPPRTSGTLVGPGTISTGAVEFAFTLTPDGETAFFNRVGTDGHIAIWMSRRDPATGKWGEASPAGFTDLRYDDVDPFVSRDGTRLLFSSDRPRPSQEGYTPSPDMNSWAAAREADGSWGEPFLFLGDALNTPQDEVFVSIDNDWTIYFTRFGEGIGRDRPTSLMTTQAEPLTQGRTFAPPEAIPTEPEGLRLSNPAISADGTLLVAAGTMNGGAPDLWYSRKLEDGWRHFVKLPPPLNTEAGEFAPYLDASDVLYFTSERGGNRDIYSIPFGEIGLN